MIDSKTLPACLWPFTSIAINDRGEVNLCPCVQWTQMKPIGNITRQPLSDIWNSPSAMAYRRYFHSGQHGEICDAAMCPYLLDHRKVLAEKTYVTLWIDRCIREKQVKLPVQFTRVKLDTDLRCNLRCTMCRKEKNENDGNEMTAHALKMLDDHWGHVGELSPAVAGEPLFIPEIRKLLMGPDLVENNVAVELVTNGTLFTPSLWKRIKHNRFSFVKVSMDSLKKDRYEAIRRGADFERLMQNLSLIAKLRRKRIIRRTQLTAVVMASNYEELPDFVAFSRKNAFDKVKFLMLNGDLAPLECLDPNAMENLKQMLSKSIFRDPVVDLWGLLQLIGESGNFSEVAYKGSVKSQTYQGLRRRHYRCKSCAVVLSDVLDVRK